jgi:hypothetical protein
MRHVVVTRDTNNVSEFKHLLNKNQKAYRNETPLKGELRKFLAASGRSGVIPRMITRSATVDKEVNCDSTLESVFCAGIPFYKICDHCLMGFSEEVL